MKPITLLLAAGSLLLSAQGLSAQTDGSGKKEYWNANTLLVPYRLQVMVFSDPKSLPR